MLRSQRFWGIIIGKEWTMGRSGIFAAWVTIGVMCGMAWAQDAAGRPAGAGGAAAGKAPASARAAGQASANISAQTQAIASSTGPADASPAILLEKGIYTEETVGDLDAAIKVYQQVIDQAKTSRKYAAQAQYRLAMCYVKKGDKPAAAEQLREVVTSYPQEKDAVALAQKELAKLSPLGGHNPEFLPLNKVVERTVYDDGVGMDFIIDFDTGKLYTPTEEDIKAKIRPQDLWNRGFDAGAETSTRGPGLYCGDIIVIPLANERWENATLDGIRDDIEIGKPGTPVVMSALAPLPRSYIFKTREGSIGAIQILDCVVVPPRHINIRYKLLEYGTSTSPTTANAAPHVVKTKPGAFANDVDPSLDKITVTFDRAMKDGSWSFTGGGETFPKGAGAISYDATKTTCTMPVKLEPGKVYWVGVNSPSHKNFKSADGVPAQRYVILFATKSADGKPTPLPDDLVQQAKAINTAPSERADTAEAALKGKLINWVEDYFSKNYRDITARKTLAWGQPSQEAGGNVSITYKYAATIWNKDKLIIEQKFTFTPEGKFISAETVEKGPAGESDSSSQPASQPSAADKKEAENLAAEGWRLWNERKLPEAEAKFQAAVAKAPTAANAWNGLGWSQLNQGKKLNAKDAFGKAVAIEPKHPAALNGLGHIAKGEGKIDQAIEHWQKAVAAAPTATAALAGLASAYMEMGQYDKAIEAYQQWLKAEPDNAEAKAGLKKAQEAGEAVKAAVPAAEEWLKLVDGGKYGESWDAAAELFRKAVPKDTWQQQLQAARQPLGKVQSRKAISAVETRRMPGAPDGQYVVVQFEMTFENKKQAVETVTPMKDKDGKWRVSGYFVK